MRQAPVVALLRRCMLPDAAACPSFCTRLGAEVSASQQLISLRELSRFKRPAQTAQGHRNRQRAGGVARAAMRQPPPPQQQRSSAPLSQINRYFATCHPGLEQVVADELLSPLIGAAGANVGKAGVYFW